MLALAQRESHHDSRLLGSGMPGRSLPFRHALDCTGRTLPQRSADFKDRDRVSRVRGLRRRPAGLHVCSGALRAGATALALVERMAGATDDRLHDDPRLEDSRWPRARATAAGQTPLVRTATPLLPFARPPPRRSSRSSPTLHPLRSGAVASRTPARGKPEPSPSPCWSTGLDGEAGEIRASPARGKDRALAHRTRGRGAASGRGAARSEAAYRAAEAPERTTDQGGTRRCTCREPKWVCLSLRGGDSSRTTVAA
jgi:hypothetical protein